MPKPTFNWTNLHPLDGSQQAAFEELCCQLAAYEVPVGSSFIRKGSPDAGVECFAILPSGAERGWQAKFFDSMGQSQWAQLDNSVKTAINKHPRLEHYTICLPFDRPDSRVEEQKSFLDKWDEHIAKWQGWAIEIGMHVDIDYWGNYEILERLSREEHRGRFYFWFGRDRFSNQWFQARLNEALKAAGPRYTPEIHVDLPISHLFDALGRTSHFLTRVKTHYRNINEALSRVRIDKWEKEAESEFIAFQSHTQKLLDLILTTPLAPSAIIPWDKIHGLASKALGAARTVLEVVEKSAEEIRKATSPGKTTASIHSEEQDLRNVQYYIDNIISEIADLEDYSESEEAQVSNLAQALLVGEAGVGKTHLLCDIAVRRLDAGLPTILLMGQQFTTNEDPWTQICRLLQLAPDTTSDEFLGALEAAAQAKQTKAVILIDALNEGSGRFIWEPHLASFLHAVSRHCWVSVAISVRSSYEKVVIPEGVEADLVRVEHHGFTEHEYQATHIFFDFYGIEYASTPYLVPEIQNPLFLKILCQGLRDSGLRKFPRGLQGITSIFKLFVDAINNKLSDASYLDFNPRRRIVWEAIDLVAAKMAAKKQVYVSIEEAEDAINQLLPRQGFEKSLYRSMVSEGILSEDIVWENDKTSDVVRFAYEKFSDHLITKHLLDAHLDNQSPEQAFAVDQPLSALVARDSWLRAGLIEAMCVQIPGRTGKELPGIAPEIADDHRVLHGFFESIVWRTTSAFSERTRYFLNKYSSTNQMYADAGFNALLTVTIVPDHPYNADFLHRNLMRREMAERDVWWSIFLHRHVGGEGAVDRIVDWAWSPETRTYADDESVRLCGTTVAWFLTTSNRFLRDKATKALVNLFTNRLLILRQVIQSFLDVNDLYVLERLFAVAYGCVLRSTDMEGIRELATAVYEWVFQQGTPPTHMLLRDYARGVIEYALATDIGLDIDVDKIKPPYGSDWPEIPSEEEVERFKIPGGSYDGDGEKWWAQNIIFHSVMGGDFAHYVIEPNVGGSHWLSLRLEEPQWKSTEERRYEFIESLSVEERHAWEKFMESYRQYEFDIFKILHNLPDDALELLIEQGGDIDETSATELSLEPEPVTVEQQEEYSALEQQVHKIIQKFRMKLDVEKREFFDTEIFPQMETPSSPTVPRFDMALAQRWIVKRVFELGWTTELFGVFDRYYIGYHGRDAHKAERIGKKYQWLALHEFLARLADNYQYRNYYFKDNPSFNRYQGAWQLHVRDIDPSCVLRATGRGDGWKLHNPCWWFPPYRNNWDTPEDDVEWMKKANDLPDPKDLLRVTNPRDNTQWLSLNGFYNWQQPTPPEIKRYDRITREVWYILRSYLVRRGDLDELFAWAKKQNFMGQWMPEPNGRYGIYLGEFFWSTRYEYESVANLENDVGDYDWRGGGEGSRVPKPILVTTEEYVHESKGFDCSIDETISIDLPTKMIVDKLNLCWNGVEGCFFGEKGQLTAFDPSVREPGPSVLLIREDALISFLKQNDFAVLWTLLGEKELIGGGVGDHIWKGRLELNGAYTITKGQIAGDMKMHFLDPSEE